MPLTSPYHAPASQTPSILVATFGPTAYWAGKAVAYDHRGFTIEGVGVVSPKGIIEFDEKGQIEWADVIVRNWVVGLAAGGSRDAAGGGGAPSVVPLGLLRPTTTEQDP